MTQEQLKFNEVKKDVHRMLQETKKITDKWQKEKDDIYNSDKLMSEKAEYLYSKF